MKLQLAVDFCGIPMKNPVTVASGTFGSGMEYAELVDLNRLGAVTTKGVANVPWEGNGVPRVCETPSGMLNAIGLQNPGMEVFIRRDLEFLKQYDTAVIANICGRSPEDYREVVARLSDEAVDLFEINISCPNVHEGGIAFGTDPKGVEAITRTIKEAAKKPVIMKLSPNVRDIAEIARAAESGGADGLSLINTITGMKIDIRKRRCFLANRTGGLSGPAIHPVAVRMVYEVCHAVKLPVIGMGGVRSGEDAIELLMAGASMVAVGTASFHEPGAPVRVLDEICAFMEQEGVSDVRTLIGAVD